MRVKTGFRSAVLLLATLCVLALSSYAQDEDRDIGLSPPPGDATGESAVGQQSLEEIDRQLNNPLTSLWSLTLQNNTGVNKGDLIDDRELSNNLFFQPAMPIPVGANREMVFIARPVFPLVTNPVLDPTSDDGVSGHDTGLGDIQVMTLIGPSSMSGWVWGVGGTFKFPTASEDTLGQGKYQAGPAGMLFHMGKPWVTGFLVQHWWSYAGDGDRPDTSQTDIQYVIRHSFPGAWSLGMGPTVSIDWEADSDDRLTLPVGLGLTKTVRWGKTPVKLRAEAQYSVIRPDSYGSEWNFRLQITPVIKSPFVSQAK